MNILLSYITASMILYVAMAIAQRKEIVKKVEEQTGIEVSNSLFALALFMLVWLAPVTLPYHLGKKLLCRTSE